MKLTKNRVSTEAEDFTKKFGATKKNWRIYATPDGKLISVESTDKEIIAFCKNLALK